MIINNKSEENIIYYRNQKLDEINTSLQLKAAQQYNKFNLTFSMPSFLTNYEKDEIVDQIFDVLYYCKYDVKIDKVNYNKEFDSQFINFNINLNDSLYNKVDEQFNDTNFDQFNNIYDYLNDYISVYDHHDEKYDHEDYIISFNIDSDFRFIHYLKYDESDYIDIINQLDLLTRQKYKLYARKKYYNESSLSLDILDAIEKFIEVVEDKQLTNKVLKITLEDNRLNDYYNRILMEINRIIENNNKFIITVSYDRKTALIKLKDDNNDITTFDN